MRLQRTCPYWGTPVPPGPAPAHKGSHLPPAAGLLVTSPAPAGAARYLQWEAPAQDAPGRLLALAEGSSPAAALRAPCSSHWMWSLPACTGACSSNKHSMHYKQPTGGLCQGQGVPHLPAQLSAYSQAAGRPQAGMAVLFHVDPLWCMLLSLASTAAALVHSIIASTAAALVHAVIASKAIICSASPQVRRHVELRFRASMICCRQCSG